MVSFPDQGTSLYLELIKKALMGTLYEEGHWTVFSLGRTRIRRLVAKVLNRRAMMLVSTRKCDPGRRERGEVWPFIGFTMVGAPRLDNIRACIEKVIAEGIPGDFIECGVWRGGASIFAKAVFKAYGLTERKVWLADSFQGMPPPILPIDKADGDFSEYRYLVASLDEVERNFRRFDLFDDNVRFIKGWFADTLSTAPIENLSILRLDGDYYSSTMDALNSLYGKLSMGGFVIVDDYNVFAGCKAAVTEFRERNGVTSEMIPIDPSGVYWRRI